MFSENDKIKMNTFIKKLISNPCFKNETPLNIESSIIHFFVQNSPHLRTTLSSNEYFPKLVWNEIQKLFEISLNEETDKQLLPKINDILQRKINFQFLNLMLNREISLQTFRSEIFKILNESLKKYEVRRNLENFIKIIDNNLIEKYLNEIFYKKAYISREFTMNERLKLSQELLAGLIKFILILSIIGYIRDDSFDMNLEQKSKQKDSHNANYEVQKKSYDKIIKQYFSGSSIFTPELINKCVSFHLNFYDNQKIPASSRFAKIFFLLSKNYSPKAKLDKGAESYEKSWFQTQRKNYKFFGLDLDMINELYRISSENNW